MDLKGFQNPDSILRPAPFWAINERITPEETARQMNDMIRVGLSGGFFHSRAGLVTDYLGEEWFQSMSAALEVAKEKDGYLWLYDEDLWPSGNAGGQVAGMKDEYRSTTLDAVIVAAGEPAPALTEDQAIRHCYAIRSRDRLNLSDYESVPSDSALDCERLFLIRTYTPKIGWWGGESYANLLHPEAMRDFVRMTHDVYLAKFGAEFGKRIPGIFTDEPQITTGHTCMPWYDGIPDIYATWHGRNFWDDFIYMFFEGPEARKVRLLIHRTILRQFLESFSKPIFEWCEKHGIQHTGHFMAEDNLEAQIGSHYGSVMEHYRYQQAPGIDHLMRQTGDCLLTCKQVSSAARQLGRSRVLTEIFGVSRHTNTFEEFKWLGDFDLVLGANFLVPHLTWYSAKGRRKRDYPPVWNYQQTYWNDLNPLNDYFTRVAHALTRGKAAVDVLLLHSIESATAAHRLGAEVSGALHHGSRKVPVDVPHVEMGAARYFDGQMRRCLEAILHAGYDCDLGDEGYIEDMGSVAGDTFHIGEMSYKVVVVPTSTTWRPTTYDLLTEFAGNGGKVIVVGEAPCELDGEDARQAWLDFIALPNVLTLPCSVPEIQGALVDIVPSTYTLRGADGTCVARTYVQHRVDGDQEIIFVANSDHDNARDYALTLINASGKPVVKWNAVKGTCETVQPTEVNGDLRYEFHLPPAGSLLLTVGGSVEGASPYSKELRVGVEPSDSQAERLVQVNLEKAGYKVALSAPARITPLPKEFEFTRTDPNVLVMDRIAVSFDDGKTFEDENLDYRVRTKIAERFGTKAALDWQPWVSVRKRLFDGKGGDIVLRYNFQSDLEQPKSFIVIEDIWKGELTVNGREVDTANPDWHWDRGFGKVEVTDLVKTGENVVDFKVNYDFLTEVEPAYVVGDFGVEMADPFHGKIVAEPETLRVGSWSKQGYPFYPGRMIYKADFALEPGKRALLRLTRPSGTLFKARVNGEEAGSILWRPYELDLTPFAKPGTNRLEIEVVSSLQNSWGPLHEKDGDNYMWCGPNAFENDPELREAFNSFDYGLLGGAEIVTV